MLAIGNALTRRNGLVAYSGEAKESPAAFLGPEISTKKVPTNHSHSNIKPKNRGKIFLEVFKGISTRNKTLLGKLFQKPSSSPTDAVRCEAVSFSKTATGRFFQEKKGAPSWNATRKPDRP